MEKIIKIGKQEVKLSNNVAWTMEYRDQFGKDIVPAIMPLLASLAETVAAILADTDDAELSAKTIAEAIEGRSMEVLLPLFQVEFVDVIVNVTWSMAKAADEDIDPPKQWVKQFDAFPLDTVVPVVYEMVMKGFVSSKNLRRLGRMKESLKSLQPLHSTTSFSPDSNEV